MDILDFFNHAQQKTLPVDRLEDELLDRFDVSLSILRCDLIHPELSGNKWFKLKYNLLAAKEQGYETLLSFGGAWSNHIHALAAAGKLFGFKTIGLIRGEPGASLNPCLSDAVANGMNLEFIDRAKYRHKQESDFIESLYSKFGPFFLIEEGGANDLGIKGCSEILSSELVSEYDLVCLACGTGATLTGLVSADCPPVLGFQVLKGQGYLEEEVKILLGQNHLQAKSRWSINDKYHFGGYAKSKPELLNFIVDFEQKNAIPLEPIYSGKMLFGIYDLVQQGYFERNTKILMIHGGGLQGARGKPAIPANMNR